MIQGAIWFREFAEETQQNIIRNNGPIIQDRKGLLFLAYVRLVMYVEAHRDSIGCLSPAAGPSAVITGTARLEALKMMSDLGSLDIDVKYVIGLYSVVSSWRW